MIDIIIPAYNCKNTIGRALASLEAQSSKKFQVIIVDDASLEDILPIIQEKKKYLDITYLKKRKNEGPGMARQTGIEISSSEYLAFLDADDVLMPYAVETWEYMSNSNPDIDIFHSHFYEQAIFDETPALLTHQRGYTWMHGKLYKRSFLEKYGIKNHPELRYMEDSYFNSICMELGKCAIITIPMYVWMNNPGSITRVDDSPFLKNCLPQFVHAIYLSTIFLVEYGISDIKHLGQTLKWIDSSMLEGNVMTDRARHELDYILQVYHKRMVDNE